MNSLEGRKVGKKSGRALVFLLSCFPNSPRSPALLLSLVTGLTAHAERLDLPTRILPVLTKAGCNSGGCHGAATG